MPKQNLKMFILIFAIIINIPAHTFAQSTDTPKVQYVCALMSMTAYNDKFSVIAKNALISYGWEFKFFQEKSNGASAKFFIAHNKSFIPGEDSYLLSICGTADLNDVSSDVKISLIPFGGSTPEEFAAFADRTADNTSPMIHNGFNKYVQAALFTSKYNEKTLGETLSTILKNNPSAHLYITGHSLGGAAAIIAAARLNSLGSDPNQISVITFGSPAVGNAAFAETYGKSINLLRIVMSGDPIRNLAQIFNSRYKLFGQEIKYPSLLSYDDKSSHEILLYTDMSLRKYYDSKGTSAPLLQQGKIFFAQPVFNIPEDQIKENTGFYIQSVLQDYISHDIKDISWGTSAIVPSLSADYKYIVYPEITISRQKYVRNSYYTSVSYTIYNAQTQQFLTSIAAASDTIELTPIEAVLYNNIKLQSDLIKTLTN